MRFLKNQIYDLADDKKAIFKKNTSMQPSNNNPEHPSNRQTMP